MLKFCLLILFAIIVQACGFQNPNLDDTQATDASFSFFGETKKKFQYKDPKTGLLVATTSYPSDWKVRVKADYDVDPIIPVFRYQIQGNKGMRAFNTPLKMHYSSSSPYLEQLMRNSGFKGIRSLKTPQELVQSEIAGKLKSKGFSFEDTKVFPALEQKVQEEIYKDATTSSEVSVSGTVWKNNSNQKALVILTYIKLDQPSINNEKAIVWLYQTDVLISEEDDFNNNVSNFIQANLENKPTSDWENFMTKLRAERQEENRRRTQASINRLDQASRQSIVNHQNRMAERNAMFNAHQQKMKGIWAAQDAHNASFMNRTFGSQSTSPSHSSGGNQQGFLNAINEEETVYNPANNTNYQIASGAKETWMDGDGNYINSNDLFFNPNANNTNNTNWNKVWEDY